MRVLALTLMVVGLCGSVASAREWTDATGKGKIDAEYMGVQSGQVKLKFNKSGRVAMVPMAALSEADQEFINGEVAREEAEKEAAEGPKDRFTQAILDDPSDPVAYINRGMARTNRREFDGAIKDFSKALDMKTDDPHAFNGRGLAYHKKGDLVQAQRDFNEAIRREPDLASAYRNRGENLYKLALDKTQSVPELDEAIEKWQRYWNFARKGNLSNTPWQPLNATKGDVSRPAALRQMAKIDLEFADRLERDYGGHHGGYSHGGHGHQGHGPGCDCEACSGSACPHCDGKGCAACGGGKPAPGLGVYPEKVQKGQMVTLVANASQLAKGMPSQAKPGEKSSAGKAPVGLESVDFYRDVNGDGLFQSEEDQYLASDGNNKDGFTAEVSTESFPPGPQSYFAVPRGAEGSGSGASPEELLSAAEALEQAAATEKQIAASTGSAAQSAGLTEDDCKTCRKDQESIAAKAEEIGEKIAAAAPDVAELLAEASKPMKAVKNRLSTAEKRPGEESKSDAESAAEKAEEASEKLAEAAEKLRAAYEAAKAGAASNPGQAPASAASGTPNSGSNEVILAAAPTGPGPGGPGNGGDGNDGDDIKIVIDDDDDAVRVSDQALDFIDGHDYDRAVLEYDRLVDYDPENSVYLRDRAATHLLRGGYDYAIRDYDKLVQVKEEPDADLYYNRGCAHLASGNLDSALSDFTKSITLNETWSLAYNNRGATYARKGDYTSAIEDFSAAIKLEPNNRLAFRNRALAYKKLGELRKAQEDFEVVLRLERAGDAAGEE